MKRVVVRQKKGRKVVRQKKGRKVVRQKEGTGEWEGWLLVVKYKHMDGIEPPFSKYCVTEILWKWNYYIFKTCCESVKCILIKMGKSKSLFIENIIVLFTKWHDFILVQKINLVSRNSMVSILLWAKSSRLLFLMWENTRTSQNTQRKEIADVTIPWDQTAWISRLILMYTS